MSSNVFKNVPFIHSGKHYNIKVFRTENGYNVIGYLDDAPAFQHGYFCDFATEHRYLKNFGKSGWVRLIQCVKADITGKKIYRVNRNS